MDAHGRDRHGIDFWEIIRIGIGLFTTNNLNVIRDYYTLRSVKPTSPRSRSLAIASRKGDAICKRYPYSELLYGLRASTIASQELDAGFF